MRVALLLAALALVGCGKRSTDTRPEGEPTRPGGRSPVPKTKENPHDELPKSKENPRAESPKVLRPPLTFSEGADIQGEYRENEVAADRKYKGQRGTRKVLIDDLGRYEKSKLLWISSEGILGQTHNLYYTLAPGQDDDFAKLCRGLVVVLECTCDGRENDDIWRGIVGFSFRLNFTDCVIVRVIDPKK